MTTGRLLWRGVRHYWPTELAVVAGMAVAVSVLGGALLVGRSVKASLRAIALERLGNVDSAITGRPFVRDALAADVAADRAFAARGRLTAPVLILDAVAEHETNRRRAAHVTVYGVDERFFTLQHPSGQPPSGGARAPVRREVSITPALAAELHAGPNEGIVFTFDRPSSIPAGALQGRREGNARGVRVTTREVMQGPAAEFALRPTQGDVRAAYVPLELLQRALDVQGRVNTVLVSTSDATAAPGGTDSRASSPDRPYRFPLPGSGREGQGEGAAGVEEIVGALRRMATLDDIGLRVRTTQKPPAVVIESESGFIGEPIHNAAVKALSGDSDYDVVPVLTYIANEIRCRDRAIPYSIVTAVDLPGMPRGNLPGDRPGSPSRTPAAGSTTGPDEAAEPIWLNEWAVRDLDGSMGDRVTLQYYIWSDVHGLETRSATFTLAGTMPMDGPGADRTLTPFYPGLTDEMRISDWDPPFPVDLSRIRRQDEDYWNRFNVAPKAFITLQAGQRLWKSSYGSITSLRAVPRHRMDVTKLADRLRARLREGIDPVALLALTVVPVRSESLQGASGATDFGEYFVYFSSFLVVSGILLAGLFFRLGVEQRLREVGLLRALGIEERTIRRLFLSEGAIVAVAGAVLGMAGAIVYARSVLWGLGTWWIDAVGTTRLALRPEAGALAAGAVAGVAIAPLVIAWTLRHVATASPRGLLAGQLSRDDPPDGQGREPVFVTRSPALVAAALGVTILVLGSFDLVGRVTAFFSAGGLLLIGSLFGLSSILHRRSHTVISGTGAWPVARLGLRGVAHRPGRAVLCVALIAFATFTIVAVGAFRRGPPGAPGDRHSGTGGYALIGESVLPIHHDPGSPAGRAALGLPDAASKALDGCMVSRFRLRAGDDASCLNLYRPARPRVLGASDDFIAQGRFSFSKTIALTDDERANPWLLLHRHFADGAVPAIGDANSLAYVLHLEVGDDFVLDPDRASPLRLRIVGSLADSVLQSELIVSGAHFVRMFPSDGGFRVFLVDTAGRQPEVVAGALENGLAEYGLDLAATSDRLARFHRVENTYLSTFQTLGGLGLVLGTLGIGVVLFRNVLERRRELALLRAVGFGEYAISLLVVAETALLVALGAAAGTASALLAVVPAILERRTVVPVGWLALLLAGIVVTGLASSVAGAVAARRFSLVSSLRTE